MSKFTLEMIDDYADKLLIGLSEDEKKMIQEEFDTIDSNMDLINKIDGIKDVEELSFPYEMEIDELRSDEDVIDSIEIDELLSNCDRTDGREIEVPKVVA